MDYYDRDGNYHPGGDPEELSDVLKLVLYVVTFFAPFIGIVAGIILSTNHNAANRKTGSNLVTFGVGWLAILCICACMSGLGGA